MQNQDVSASLQIVQALNTQLELSDHHLLVDITESFQIHVNNNNEQKMQSIIKNSEDDDFLNYSLDQKSISFIMEQIIQIPKQSSETIKQQCDILKENNYQNKRSQQIIQQKQVKKKRRQIFDKYKKQSFQSKLFQSNINNNHSQSEFMNTFDQVFKLKTPDKQKQQKQTVSTTTGIRSTHSHPIIRQFRMKTGENIIEQNVFKKKQSAIYIQNNQLQHQTESINTKLYNSNSLQRNSKQEEAKKQPFQKLGVSDNFNFNMEERFSAILSKNNPNQISKDDADIQNILQSQIFNSAKLDYTISNHNQTSYKNIQISSMNPSLMIDPQRDKNQNTLAFDQFSSRMLLKQKSQTKLPTFIPGDLLSRNLSQQKLKITINQQQRIALKQTQPIQILIGRKSEAYQQKRVPKILRQVRRLNTLLPNFSFKNKLAKIHQQSSIHLKQLISEIKKTLDLLNNINVSLKNKRIRISKAIAILINEHSVQTFLNSGWEQYQKQNLEWIDQIKPRQNFVKRVYDYQKIQNALLNYIKISDYYLNMKLNFQDQRAIKKYYDIRVKFWQIQKNIKLISEDLYSEAIQRVIPSHYYEFFYFLKNKNNYKINQKNIQIRRQILAKYNCLKEQQDPLTLSCVGKSVKRKAQIQLSKMSIY